MRQPAFVRSGGGVDDHAHVRPDVPEIFLAEDAGEAQLLLESFAVLLGHEVAEHFHQSCDVDAGGSCEQGVLRESGPHFARLRGFGEQLPRGGR